MSQRRGNSSTILLLAGVQAVRILRRSEQTEPSRAVILSLSSFIFPFLYKVVPGLNPRPGSLLLPVFSGVEVPFEYTACIVSHRL